MKSSIIKFIVNNKVNCYRAFKNGIKHKDFKTIDGKILIELARRELNYSIKTWSGDIYSTLWRYYKTIVIEDTIH